MGSTGIFFRKNQNNSQMDSEVSDSKIQIQFSKPYLFIITGFRQDKIGFLLVIIHLMQELANTNAVICTMEKIRLHDHITLLSALESVISKNSFRNH